MTQNTLYYKPTCPFCRKVLSFMQNNEIELPLKNIDESASMRQELISKGGKQQVPALETNGTILYESDDIINYLKKTNA